MDEGESMEKLKSRIQKVAKAEGMEVNVKTAKKKGIAIVWKAEWEIDRLMRHSRFPTIDDDLAQNIYQGVGYLVDSIKNG